MYTPRAPAAWISSPWGIIDTCWLQTRSVVFVYLFLPPCLSLVIFVLLFDLSVHLLMLINHIMHADISQVALAKL